MQEGVKKDLLFALLVATIAFIVYANSLGNGFLGDDDFVILDNPALDARPFSPFSSIDTVSDTVPLPYYRPLTLITFYLEKQIHDLNPFWVRLANITLHSAIAFLLYFFARSLLKERYAALLAALIFAVHPLHSEAVDFNSARNNLLVCFFILAAYLLHHRSIIQKKFSFAIAGGVCLLAALFSKESAVAVIPFILALEITSLRDQTSRMRISSLIRLLPCISATGCYLLLRWMTLSKLGLQSGILPGVGASTMQNMYIIPDLASRLMNNIYIIPHYLLTVIRPTALSPLYTIPDDLNLLALPLFTGWLCIIMMLVWVLTRGRSPASVFGLLWMIVFWLPVSGIIYFPSTPLADRFLYIPSIGLWLIVADQLTRFTPVATTARRSVTTAVVVMLITLATLTILRNNDWKSGITLFTRLTEQYPNSALGHANLGDSYLKPETLNDHNRSLAEKQYEIALQLDPQIQVVQLPLGHLKYDKGDFEAALLYYTRALNILPTNKQARVGRGLTYEKLGNTEDSLRDFKFFLTIPGYVTPGLRQFVEKKVAALEAAVSVNK